MSRRRRISRSSSHLWTSGSSSVPMSSRALIPLADVLPEFSRCPTRSSPEDSASEFANASRVFWVSLSRLDDTEGPRPPVREGGVSRSDSPSSSAQHACLFTTSDTTTSTSSAGRRSRLVARVLGTSTACAAIRRLAAARVSGTPTAALCLANCCCEGLGDKSLGSARLCEKGRRASSSSTSSSKSSSSSSCSSSSSSSSSSR
mmetsp:Transcript_55569/g.159833  ORF Transcript_55569/g.159833 Transcript_55569/m.159833 type:complete len:203 (+) Transcript_55569:907-1515(+)